MADVPLMDVGGYVMLGSDELFLELLAKGEPFDKLRDYVGWSIHAARALGVPSQAVALLAVLMLRGPQTAAELRAYAPKLKPGGIMAGHDYSMGNWVKGLRYGVIEAVHEFCVEHDWELRYLTVQRLERPSFAISRLSRT